MNNLSSDKKYLQPLYRIYDFTILSQILSYKGVTNKDNVPKLFRLEDGIISICSFEAKLLRSSEPSKQTMTIDKTLICATTNLTYLLVKSLSVQRIMGKVSEFESNPPYRTVEIDYCVARTDAC